LLNEVTNYALIFSLFISFESAFAQPGTGQSDDAKRFAGANAFGEYVVNAFVKEDYKRFKIASTLAVTKDETRRTVQDISILIKKGIKDGTIPPHGRNIVNALQMEIDDPDHWEFNDKQMKEAEPRFQKSFQDICAQDKALGFDWADAKYLRTDTSKTKID